MAQKPVVESASILLAVVVIFVALHLVVWVGLPSFLEGSIRLDVAEHVAQGREWLLSYPKHPPFTPWLVALASDAGSARYAVLYLTGQILALTGLVFAAILLWRWREPSVAVTAMFIGMATPFLTYVPIQVNHNIGVMPFWGAALAAGFFAFERGLLRDWLAFGVALGLGMWAKYSILHLLIPLMIVFFAVPAWRRQIRRPGPWAASVLAVAIVAPHVVALASDGSALLYAVRTNILGYAHNFRSLLGFLLGAVAMLALMGSVAVAAVGFSPLRTAMMKSVSRVHRDRLTLYLHVALFGPLAVIVVSSLFEVRPRVFWLTPIALSAALWWANMTSTAAARRPSRAIAVAGALALSFVASYVIWRQNTPRFLAAPSYGDFDGPVLARLAQQYWSGRITGPISYIVSFDRQRGRQAAGSIAFDIHDRPHIFENGDLRFSPWIDVADLNRKGALVVSTRPIISTDNAAGRPIEDVVELERPTIRMFRRPRAIYFGIIRPQT